MPAGRPKGSKNGAGAVQPKPFRAVREDAGGWLVVTGVGAGTRKARARELSVLVPVPGDGEGQSPRERCRDASRRDAGDHGMRHARNVSLIRVLTMMHYLRGGRQTLEQLAEEFKVSTRTVRRDLEALSVAGVPVRYSGDTGERLAGYWWVVRE